MSGGGGGNCKLDQAVNSDDKWARVKIKSVSNKVNKVSILILKYIVRSVGVQQQLWHFQLMLPCYSAILPCATVLKCINTATLCGIK